MATKAAKDPEEKKGTRRIPIFLSEEQIAWLKKDKDGASAAVRALIAEAMAMENLARSVGKTRSAGKKAAVRKKK
jgi:putative SOS response-associated peptidase YedK